MDKLRLILFSFILLVLIGATFVVFYLFGGRVAKAPDNEKKYFSYESEMIMSNQEIEEKSQPKYQTIRAIETDDHVKGNPEAKVQVIVYEDFECVFCAGFHETLKEVQAEFSDDVVIAFRHNPLPSHTNAMSAAIASECASEQGKFWEMFDLLFENNNLSESQYLEDAKNLDLDSVEFSKCIYEERYKEKILTQMLEGKSFGAYGTPTIFVNDIIMPGAYPMDDFVGSDGRTYEGLRSVIKKQLE